MIEGRCIKSKSSETTSAFITYSPIINIRINHGASFKTVIIYAMDDYCCIVCLKDSSYLYKVWVLTIDNQDVKRYTFTEATCELLPS